MLPSKLFFIFVKNQKESTGGVLFVSRLCPITGVIKCKRWFNRKRQTRRRENIEWRKVDVVLPISFKLSTPHIKRLLNSNNYPVCQMSIISYNWEGFVLGIMALHYPCLIIEKLNTLTDGTGPFIYHHYRTIILPSNSQVCISKAFLDMQVAEANADLWPSCKRNIIRRQKYQPVIVLSFITLWLLPPIPKTTFDRRLNKILSLRRR